MIPPPATASPAAVPTAAADPTPKHLPKTLTTVVSVNVEAVAEINGTVPSPRIVQVVVAAAVLVTFTVNAPVPVCDSKVV